MGSKGVEGGTPQRQRAKGPPSPPELGLFLSQRGTLVNYEILINLPQLKCLRAEDNGMKNNLNHIM